MSDNYLQHYGIKGMKWGVRRKQSVKKSAPTKQNTAKDDMTTKQKAVQTAAKGAKKTAKVLNKIGKLYLTDQIFFGGKGTKAAKTTVKYTGRAAVTAYMMARGGHDIRWYDN